MNICEMPVKKYIEILSSDMPAPGGGSAGALCGAQGAALALMVARLTFGRAKYEDNFELCAEVEKKAQPLMDKLLSAVDKDTEAFTLVSSAYKMPKQSEAEKKARTERIEQASISATQAPLEVMRLALEALKLTQKLVGNSNPNVASDLGVAAVNLLACAKSEWLNVLINLGSIKDADLCGEFKKESSELLKESEILADEIFSRIEEKYLK